MTPRKDGRSNAPELESLIVKPWAKLVDFWKAQAIENMKRALRAETMLAKYEGLIG